MRNVLAILVQLAEASLRVTQVGFANFSDSLNIIDEVCLTRKSIFTPRYERLKALLVEARKEAGLTQADLANRLGRPQSFVSKYERGERRLDVVELLEVTDAIGVKTAKLIERIERA